MIGLATVAGPFDVEIVCWVYPLIGSKSYATITQDRLPHFYLTNSIEDRDEVVASISRFPNGAEREMGFYIRSIRWHNRMELQKFPPSNPPELEHVYSII